MDSGPAVSETDASTGTAVTDALAGKLAQTRARCQAALAAADRSVQRAQVALATAEEGLRRTQDAQMRFRRSAAHRDGICVARTGTLSKPRSGSEWHR
jgi:hypothetical protein